MKILIVGGGAVGQVYARHLTLGGAHVGFWVKEHYLETMQRPLRLYPLREKKSDAVYLETHSAHATLADLPSDWDQVWFCISSALSENPPAPR